MAHEIVARVASVAPAATRRSLRCRRFFRLLRLFVFSACPRAPFGYERNGTAHGDFAANAGMSRNCDSRLAASTDGDPATLTNERRRYERPDDGPSVDGAAASENGRPAFARFIAAHAPADPAPEPAGATNGCCVGSFTGTDDSTLCSRDARSSWLASVDGNGQAGRQASRFVTVSALPQWPALTGDTCHQSYALLPTDAGESLPGLLQQCACSAK